MVHPRDWREAATADENYRALTRFMAEARSYLRTGGRVLLNFGTSGDLDYLRTLIDRSGFNKEVISELELARDAWTVHYYVFRLTAPRLPAAIA
jgi:release factor glutamine methyltransferase